jgi:hypothetical protein
MNCVMVGEIEHLKYRSVIVLIFGVEESDSYIIHNFPRHMRLI